MDERMFTASVELDRKVLKEFGYCAGPWFVRGLLLAAIPLIVFFLVMSPAHYRMLFSASFIVIFLLAEFLNYRSYNRNLDQNGGKPIFNSIVITGSGIRITNPMKEKAEDLPYSRIIGAWRSRNLLYLLLGKKEGRLIDLRMVSGGTPEELMDFIREHCPHWKQQRIPKRLNRGIQQGILVALTIVGVLTSTGGPGIHAPKDMGAREAAQVLSELGISGISEETILEVEAYQEEYGYYNPIPDLLCYAGFGEHDPETWEWTPAENGVYTFDMESWEVSMMYTDFLTGVAAMSGGELEFTDIVEEDSNVNWEEGTGTKTVSFTFRGERYSLEAQMLYDWFDTAFLDEFARIVNGSGEEKKLWYLTDFQLVNVFYQDDDWARQFRKQTGYSLANAIIFPEY